MNSLPHTSQLNNGLRLAPTLLSLPVTTTFGFEPPVRSQPLLLPVGLSPLQHWLIPMQVPVMLPSEDSMLLMQMLPLFSWFRMCVLRFPFCEKHLPQMGHENGFWPSCDIRWILRLLICENVFWQMSQE